MPFCLSGNALQVWLFASVHRATAVPHAVKTFPQCLSAFKVLRVGVLALMALKGL